MYTHIITAVWVDHRTNDNGVTPDPHVRTFGIYSDMDDAQKRLEEVHQSFIDDGWGGDEPFACKITMTNPGADEQCFVEIVSQRVQMHITSK